MLEEEALLLEEEERDEQRQTAFSSVALLSLAE